MKLRGVLLATANCRIEVLNSVLGVAGALKVASILRPVTACMYNFYVRPLLLLTPTFLTVLLQDRGGEIDVGCGSKVEDCYHLTSCESLQA